MEDVQREIPSGCGERRSTNRLRGYAAIIPARAGFGRPPVLDDKSQEARDQALLLSQDATVLQHICPALKSASGDLESIAKIVGGALFPLSLTPAAPVSMSALAIGALAVLTARAGVAALCPECGGKAKEQG